jgi:hypothetical protein
MRKIIFLDIDGVLNTERWHCQTASNELQDEYGYKFDPVAVNNLSKIIEETGADIVISSSWKFMGLSKMRKMWKDRKLPGKIIDITPNYMSDELLLNDESGSTDYLYIKGVEVKGWLALHGDDVSRYVIIDDIDDFLPEQQFHFVQTDPEVGITNDDVKKVVHLLNT